MRLQKFLARAGIASRRGAEEMIRQGLVTVNGRVIRDMGVVIDPGRDAVKCQGRLVRPRAGRKYLLLFKPRSVVSTLSDPEGRPTVRDFLPVKAGRVFPVGRLDWDAEGVILFTDDGDLAHRLAHPRYGAERTYHVKVRGALEAQDLHRLQSGIRLEDGMVKPEKVRVVRRSENSTWVALTLREGRYHEVKRIFASLGVAVQKLRRVSFAGLAAGTLRPGQWRALTAGEIDGLRREIKA